MLEQLKRKELVELNVVLSQLKNEKCDKRFKFAVCRNLENLEPEMKAIQETQKDNPKYVEFLEKRQQIGQECADRNENGEPILQTIHGQQIFIIKERKDEANEKINKLNEEYSEVIKEKEEEMKQFRELLEEEISVDMCKVSFDYLPEDADYGKLKYIIKETPEEIEEKYLS